MKHILTIVGARPQFIKAAAISHAVRDLYSGQMAEDLLHTGQHYDDRMSAQFFAELDLPQPRYNLGVGSGSHATQTALMLKGIEDILIAESYDGVLVYGDTNSTLAGALAAAKIGVPVYHVEAGLRSYNRAMPEELNRVLTDHASSLLFAPTQTAVQNLRKEGFDDKRTVFSGDVMLDNLLHYAPLAKHHIPSSAPFILATIHRNFNTDDEHRLKNIIATLGTVAEEHNCEVILPLHPRTRQRLDNTHGIDISNRIRVVEPLSYLETLAALKECQIVLTDSGGLQKEAYFSGKGCVVLRPETEWIEIVESGAAMLADAEPNQIVDATRRMFGNSHTINNNFGDGHAANTIIDNILKA